MVWLVGWFLYQDIYILRYYVLIFYRYELTTEEKTRSCLEQLTFLFLILYISVEMKDL